MTRARPLSLLLPVVLILVGMALTPPPWGNLWFIATVLGSVGYVGNRPPQRWGWAAPISVGVWLILTGNAQWAWGWMLFGVVASISLLGLASSRWREKSLWALLPLLVLVVLFPLSGSYQPAVKRAVAAVEKSGDQAYESYQALGIEGAALSTLAEQAEVATERLTTLVENLLPALLFLLAATMVAAGALLARRLLQAVGRPGDTAVSFVRFRMPEASEWILVLSLASVALRQPQLATVGLNVAICLGIGYWLQGLAVTYFAALGRGIRPGIFWVLFFFVLFSRFRFFWQ